ncbi:MAG: prolyl-tRNA synthetase [Candidatus Magasanikbacteria bacterium CG_4_9_14_0_2_um_filter_42_11]|uniref:Proline--tRNA ligase n=1 Tax=Candidatus Magasanikbacteria bacterium CG_4_9_14_0_2_um_filter_42_11 TaxID=1974643 RepID=A0A2M8F939_9BACT|nr:MAG: prolyl-tRNA synthetase [Candidatus Magasanikbacteria bacterium CG10_big_fil_rev_8_21_14_0_10_43_9]PIY92667.1 MAG: prolyl-tRNA synthetase [Candidatus Magasanikbacteria bacterium CG_4_10_14_0_8_um_filter_42_12]PJC52264.1 MAG: prolyl-tRNA synthetase [Candidatus Magasanikbacteria bacterium CG_4_9_14_0_2_um_filter_42_11]
MKQSHLFTKTKKEVPKDEASKNAQLLIKAGFIYKEMAGVYAYLPLGLRVLEKIKQIVREEMDAIGGQEFIMTAIQRKELWEKTDRWSDDNVDVWFKSALKNGTEIGFGWSHEEPITDLMKQYLTSYRDLPTYVYQFQTKLRNELRAKSGIMRGREFIMKDMYSYSLNAEQHQTFYDAVIEAYLKVFARVGLGDDTYVTFATGGAFTQFSHEFQTITDAGEDVIYVNREKHIAINEEVLSDTVLKELGVTKDELEKVKTAEVGNIFNFGTVKCEQLGLSIVGAEGQSVPVHLGSYGIGITRLMGVIVEHFSDEKGIIWPNEVAPFQVHLVSLCKESEDVAKADALYKQLQTAGVEVLYDDRDARPGEKFADSDLIGIPLRIVISPRSLENNQVEFKYRQSGEETHIFYTDVLTAIQ